MNSIAMQDKELSPIKKWMLFFLFFASLQKFSMNVAGNGVTANYVYVLFPFIFWFLGIKRRLVMREGIFQVLAIYSVIYLIGFSTDMFAPNDLSNPMRRFASFLVFIFPLSLALIEFKPGDLELFKLAIIIASLYYCFVLISRLVFLAGAVSISTLDLKATFGSQRYGFVLCLGFFIALFNEKLILKKRIFLQRILICSTIFIGLILTFSRSSIVSLGAGFLFLVLVGLLQKKRSIAQIRPIYLLIPLVFIVFTVILFQFYFGINFLNWYQYNFIGQYADLGFADRVFTKDPGNSDAFRYYILTYILQYLSAHPLFGSMYQGLYLLFDEFRDGMSTHNQYTDVFLRTGLVGGTLWLVLLRRIYRFCSEDRGLRVGLISVLVYGLFHETFKESQGSFMFGMLLSFAYMAAALKRRNEVPVLTAQEAKAV